MLSRHLIPMVLILSVAPFSLASSEENQTHWSLQSVRDATPPRTTDTGWPRNAIDRFILARLEAKDIAPNRRADPATLLRRLAFDLTGLPPAPEQIDAFVADPSPAHYARLVDAFLDSPRYGERWARHWLDVARYTESDGFERDQIRDDAWHYRDYVIKAFNEDKPYDRFVTEQIAGDVLPDADSDSTVATSFLVCGSYDRVGAGQQSPVGKARVREDELEGLIATTGQAFLGLTLHCARCHDHPLDPITDADYYRFKSIFDGVYHGTRPILSNREIVKRNNRVKDLQARVNDLQEQITQIESNAIAAALEQQPGDTRTPLTPVPQPVALWTFEGDAKDSVGQMNGALRGGARVEGGRLILDGDTAHMVTPLLKRDLREKTLEAWVLPTEIDRRGGGALTVESNDGQLFDAIVYGEREPRKWIAGSNNFHRTRDRDATPESDSGEFVHVAITYAEDGTVALYRNGVPYGKPYAPTPASISRPNPDQALQTYRAGASRFMIGRRHTGSRGFFHGQVEQAAVYDRPLTPPQVAASFLNRGRRVPPAVWLAAMTNDQRDRHTALKKQLTNARRELADTPKPAFAYAGIRKQPEPTRYLTRGDATQPQQVVTPGAPEAIVFDHTPFDLTADGPEHLRRLKLAQWLTDPQNPLTARVMVNRIWRHHFTRGIVATPSDFGKAGDEPSHPELLDYLARQFVRSGWSIKRMHRLILNSATYQQASAPNTTATEADPENRLLGAYPVKRLEAEAVRDAMLAVSGQLNTRMGGPGYRPFDVIVNNAHHYLMKDVDDPAFNRRTVYRINVNSAKSPMLESLDCPDPAVTAPNRRVTTTPLQALALMNNPFVQRQARYLAQRVHKLADGDLPEAVRHAYRYAFGREPAPNETRQAVTLAKEHGLNETCWALLNASEFLYVR
ncbi:MAG: DUF1553 domain-containing protein [Planctomycetota bacterium]|jgi:hypothetical protein